MAFTDLLPANSNQDQQNGSATSDYIPEPPSPFGVDPVSEDSTLAAARRNGSPLVPQQSQTGVDVPQLPESDLQPQFFTAPKFATPEEPNVLKFGSVADPMQLDMDPFGEKTVQWGNGDHDYKYVASANVCGKAMSRDKLLESDDGRKLVKLMEDNRNGRRRGFWDSISPSEWSWADVPFFGMVASVGWSIADAKMVHDTLGKMMDGKEITDEEAIKTRLYMAEQERQANGTWGSTVGDIVRAAPGFMLEFGASDLAWKGVMKGVKSAVAQTPEMMQHFLGRNLKYAAKDAVDLAFDAQFAKAAGKTVETAKAVRDGWKAFASGTDVAKNAALLDEVRKTATEAILPQVKAALGAEGDLAVKTAKARVETELARAIARNSSSSPVVRWMAGTGQALRDHASRALLDFGNMATDAYSATGKEMGSAFKTLNDALGILLVEAPIRGAMIGAPQALVARPLTNLAVGGSVGSQQLSLEASAVRTGNKALFSAAESISAGLSFLEYASENSGRGFGKLFRAAGLGIAGGKALGVADDVATRGLLPEHLVESCGSCLRNWVAKAVGTTDDFLRGHLDNQVTAVRRFLDGKAKATGVDLTDDMVRGFVTTGNAESLGALASEVGPDAAKFIRDAARNVLKSDREALTYRSYFRYVLADMMARRGWGPREAANCFRSMGYDGIVEEMLEERYSDFAKGLFGWDDKSDSFHGIGPFQIGLERGSLLENVKKAFENSFAPGWDQLAAEAVGFAMPMMVRSAVFQIQKAAGGSDLSFLENYSGTLREFRGANNIVEVSSATQFAETRRAIDELKREKAVRNEAGELVAGAEKELADLNAELEKGETVTETRTEEDGSTSQVAVTRPYTEEYKAERRGEVQRRIDDIDQRIKAAEKTLERQRTVEGAADYNASQIRAFEAPNLSIRADSHEFDQHQTPTDSEAARAVTAHNVMIDGAARAGYALSKARAAAVDPEKTPLHRRVVSKVTGILGALVTGDLSMASYNPMAWAMVDRGFTSNFVSRLADIHDVHFNSTKDAIRDRITRRVEAGETVDRMEPTDEEVEAEMKEAYEKDAKAAMSAYLAATGVRVFSRSEMLEQARRIVAEDNGGTYEGHDAEVADTLEKIAAATVRALASGKIQSTDVRDITRGIISDDSPFADDRIRDAALRMSGFSGLSYVSEVTTANSLVDAARAREVDADVVARVARFDASLLGKDPESLTDDERKAVDQAQADISSIASQLGYKPTTNEAGKRVLAYSPSAVKALNARVVNICRKAMACSGGSFVTLYSRENEVAPMLGEPGTPATATEYVRVYRDDKGWRWTEVVNGQSVNHRAGSEKERDDQLATAGWKRSSSRILFTTVKEIRCRDAAVMLEKLGRSAQYYRSLGVTVGTDRLESAKVHPFFRMRKNDKGELERIPIAEAERMFREELALASRYREVMSLDDSSQLAAFRRTVDEPRETTVRRRDAAKAAYGNVFGSEQGQDGYLPAIEKILSASGVQMPGGLSVSRLHAGQTGYYTLNTRSLGFSNGDSYVFVDPSRDVDYDGPLLERAITNNMLAFRELWMYNPRREKGKEYGDYFGIIKDIVKRLDRVAVDMITEAKRNNRDGEADAMARLRASLVEGSSAKSPKMRTISWIMRNAVFGQIDREQSSSSGTTYLGAAAMRLTDALRQTPEFYAFLGFSDVIFGGTGFAGSRDPNVVVPGRGLVGFMREFNGDDSFSIERLLKSMCPVNRSGNRMTVPEFMDYINKTIAGVKPAGAAPAAKAAPANAADFIVKAKDDPMEFFRQLAKAARLDTLDAARTFMAKVLTQAGVNAGNFSDLANWKIDLEEAEERRTAAAKEKERRIAQLTEEIARLTRKLEESRKSEAPGSAAEAEATAREIEAKKEELSGAKAEPTARKPATGTTDQPPTPENVPQRPAEDEEEYASDTDDGDGEYDLQGSAGEVQVDSSVEVEAESTADSEENLDKTAQGAAIMSDAARRHVVRSIVSAIRATGAKLPADAGDARDKAFADHVRRMFQSISDEDLAASVDLFNDVAAQVDAKKSDDDAGLSAIQDLLDAEGASTSGNEMWNDRAISAYNSLKPFLEMMEASVPLAKRNFQGLCSILRKETAEYLSYLSSADARTRESDPSRFTGEALRVWEAASRLLNPRASTIAAADTVAKRFAVHAQYIDRFLGSSDSAKSAMDAMLREFLEDDAGGRPRSSHLAAFFSFLASLDAGTRANVMLLVSSSSTCGATAVDRATETVTFIDDEGAESRASVKTDKLFVGNVSTGAGTTTVTACVDAFLPLVGMTAKNVRKLYVDLFNDFKANVLPRMRRTLFSKLSDGFRKEGEYVDEEGNSFQEGAYVDCDRGMLAQDLEVFRHNAKLIADLLARHLGRENSLSCVLTSDMLFNRISNDIVRSQDYGRLLRYRDLFDKFAIGSKGVYSMWQLPTGGFDKDKPFPGPIMSVLYRFSEAAPDTVVDKGKLVDAVQAAMATGSLVSASLSYAGADATTNNEWLTLMSEFTQALPATVVPARKVKGRTTKNSNVAVAAPGVIPIVLRYMTTESSSPLAFRKLAMDMFREAASRRFLALQTSDDTGYIGMTTDKKSLIRAMNGSVLWPVEEYARRRAEFVETEVAKAGGEEGIIASCIGTMTWPDAAHTPIVARNLTPDYDPVELGNACREAYDRASGPNSTKIWYIPLFSGVHVENLMQVPMNAVAGSTYVEAAKELNRACGVHLLYNDSKRSQITSATAPETPMIGCKIRWSGDVVPEPMESGVEFGENRIHLAVNLAVDENGNEYSQEAMHGMTIAAGCGPSRLVRMSKNPKLRTGKFHGIGTGEDLEMAKAATSIVTDSDLLDGGVFPPGTMPRAFADHILGFRTPEDREKSSDYATDEDSYKVGPLRSRALQIAGALDENGKPSRSTSSTILAYVKRLLKGDPASGVKPMTPKEIMDSEVRMVNWANEGAPRPPANGMSDRVREWTSKVLEKKLGIRVPEDAPSYREALAKALGGGDAKRGETIIRSVSDGLRTDDPHRGDARYIAYRLAVQASMLDLELSRSNPIHGMKDQKDRYTRLSVSDRTEVRPGSAGAGDGKFRKLFKGHSSIIIGDTETYGLDPANGGRIVELVARRLVPDSAAPGGYRVETFDSGPIRLDRDWDGTRRSMDTDVILDEYGKATSKRPYQVGGITDAKLKGGRSIAEVLREFAAFVHGGKEMGEAERPLMVFHNASFDSAMLLSEYMRLGGKDAFSLADCDWLDTALVAQDRYPMYATGPKSAGGKGKYLATHFWRGSYGLDGVLRNTEAPSWFKPSDPPPHGYAGDGAKNKERTVFYYGATSDKEYAEALANVDVRGPHTMASVRAVLASRGYVEKGTGTKHRAGDDVADLHDVLTGLEKEYDNLDMYVNRFASRPKFSYDARTNAVPASVSYGVTIPVLTADGMVDAADGKDGGPAPAVVDPEAVPAAYVRQAWPADDFAAQYPSEKIEDRPEGVFLSDPMKLSQVLPGLQITAVKGLHKGASKDGVAYDISYRSDSMLALRVANIAHDSKPELKRNGKNYTMDETTVAVMQLARMGADQCGSDAAIAQEEVLTTLSSYAIVAGAVATDTGSVLAELSEDAGATGEKFRKLRDAKADPDGLEFRQLMAQIASKRIRDAMLCPVLKTECVLTSCGATLNADKTAITDHSVSEMRRDVHHGSVVFDESDEREMRLYGGAKRRLAYAEVNVNDPSFRYSMFLDEDAAIGAGKPLGEMPEGADRQEWIMSAIEAAATTVRAVDERVRQATNGPMAMFALKKWRNSLKLAEDAEAGKDKFSEGQKKALSVFRRATAVRGVTTAQVRAFVDAYDRLLAEQLNARTGFFSMFVDHHGQRCSEAETFVSDPKTGEDLGTVKSCSRWSIEDLFSPVGRTAEKFDRSAVDMDGVHLDVYDENGVRDASKSSAGRRIVLMGSAVMAPRTPSYNGGAFLQFVRASFPVKEYVVDHGGQRMWRTSPDALIALDPWTRDEILGCDNDGDKSAVTLLGADVHGIVHTGDVEALLPQMSADSLEPDVSSPDALESAGNRTRLLEKAADPEAASKRGGGYVRFVEKRNGAFTMTKSGRQAVSNTLVRGLLQLAMSQPVPPGKGRRPYASNESGRTKSQPFDDPRWWKPQGADDGFGGKPRMIDFLPPDVIAENEGIDDPEVQDAVSRSSKRADKARALFVSAALTLHVAYSSRFFERDSVGVRNNLGLFHSGFTADEFQAFMRHFDGLPNATFDDEKERICMRLGLLPETADIIVCDLLNSLRRDDASETAVRRVPTTDEEWFGVLRRFVLSVRDRDPDGKLEFDPENEDFKLSIGKDKSRLFMARAAERTDRKWGNLLRDCLFLGGIGKDGRRDGLLKSLGLRLVGDTLCADGDGTSFRSRIGHQLANRPGMLSAISMACEHGGRNNIAGYFLWLVSTAAGSVRNAKDGTSSEDLENVSMFVRTEAERFTRFLDTYRAWQTAKDFSAAVNYSKADPGARNARSRKKKADDAYARVVDARFRQFPGDNVFKRNIQLMRAATRMASSCRIVAAVTPEARAYDAVESLQSDVKPNQKLISHVVKHYGEDSEVAVDLVDVAGTLAAATTNIFDAGLVSIDDKDELRDNMTSVPYVIAAIQTLPSDLMFTKDTREAEKFFRAVAAGAAKSLGNGERANIVNFRCAVESMFSVMYAMMATAERGVSYPGFSFLGERPDSRFTASEGRGAVERHDYGLGGNVLRTIVQVFSSRDEAAIRRLRSGIQDILDGKFDKAVRASRYAGDLGNNPHARSFMLSIENLAREFETGRGRGRKTVDNPDSFVRELNDSLKYSKKDGGTGRARALARDAEVAISVIHEVAKAFKMDPNSIAMSPSSFFRQLMPMYVACVAPVRAAPSYEEFTTSLLTCFPGMYEAWSHQQALNDKGFDFARTRYMQGDDNVVPLVDASAALNLAPVDHTETIIRHQEKFGDIEGTTRGQKLLAARSLPEGKVCRRNPESRHIVDMFAHDGFLFKVARVCTALNQDMANRAPDDPTGRRSAPGSEVDVDVDVDFFAEPVAPTVRRETPAPAPESNRAESLVALARKTFAALPGIRVSAVDGNTLLIESSIIGNDFVKARTVNGRRVNGDVRTVVRVDLLPEGFDGSAKCDLNSTANAVSITNALAKAGILDISPDDFLTRLSLEERRAIVARFMPRLLDGMNGLSLRTPTWSMTTKGVLTLAGAVQLRAADEKTLYHEYFHSLVGMMRGLGFLSGDEGGKLARVFGAARSERELFNEEEAADRFSHYVRTRIAKAPEKPFLQRCLDLLNRLVSIIAGRGDFHYDMDTTLVDDNGMRVGKKISPDEMFFNMLLTGTAIDTADSARDAANTRLSPAAYAEVGVELDAVKARMDKAVSAPHEDRFSETGDNSEASRALVSDVLGIGADGDPIPGVRLQVPILQKAVADLVAARGGIRAGDAAETDDVSASAGEAEAEPSDPLADELENFGNLVDKLGIGFSLDRPADALRMSQFANACAVAISKGMDEVEPQLRAMLEQNSSLADMEVPTIVQGVVEDGIHDAATILGIDLKKREGQLRNLVYANCLRLYLDVASRYGYNGGKRKADIMHKMSHRGKASRQKYYVSESDIAAVLLVSGGLTYDEICENALRRLSALARGAESKQLRDEIMRLRGLLEKAASGAAFSRADDPLRQISAGVERAERDLDNYGRRPHGVGALRFTRSPGAAGRRNKANYMLDNEKFVEAYELAARTAYVVTAARKMYRKVLGADPRTRDGESRPGGKLHRVRPVVKSAYEEAFAEAAKTATMLDGTPVSTSSTGHLYYTREGDSVTVYPSCTQILDLVVNPFDAEAKARESTWTEDAARAKLAEWKREADDASELGTFIHSVYEKALMGEPFDASGITDLRRLEMVKRALEIAEGIRERYDVLGTEVIVCDPKGSRVAGTIDCLARDKKTGRLAVIDHKTCKYIGEKGYNGQLMLNGFDIEDSKLNRYALQVGLYRELLYRAGGVVLADGTRFAVTRDEPVDLRINLFNGLDDDQLEKINRKAANVYKERPDIAVRERWYEDIPDYSSYVKKLLDMAAARHDDLVDKAVDKAVIPEPASPAEVASALELSLTDFLDDPSVIDPFAEVGLYVNNPGEWLASTMRDTFGGRPLRDLFQDEHGRARSNVDRFTRKYQWWSMYLGENCIEGSPLLAVKKTKGHFVLDNGRIAYDEEGHDVTGFDNYSRRALGMGRLTGATTDVTLDRSDKEMIDFWLKMCYFRGMGGKWMYTGVDGIAFGFKDLRKADGSAWTKEDFSAAEVERKYNDSQVKKQLSKAYIALHQLSDEVGQIPKFVTGGAINLRDRLAEGFADSLNEVARYYADNPDAQPFMANTLVLQSLMRKGLVRAAKGKDGKLDHATVVVSCSEIDDAFHGGDTFAKLVKAGRDPKMLTAERVIADCRDAYMECDALVRRSPWMSSGDGRHFNQFGSMMPFFRGPGVFMYYANRIGRDERRDVGDRRTRYEQEFLGLLRTKDGPVTDNQLFMLHDLFGLDSTGSQLRQDIASGMYSDGTSKSVKTGLVADKEILNSSHALGRVIYNRLNELAWCDDDAARRCVGTMGGRGSVSTMIDMYEQNIGEGTSVCAPGMNADQMYEMHGVLPANFQVFHAVNTALSDAARTLQFRNTFVGFLFTVGKDGQPICYAKPTLTDPTGRASDGIPEEVWEMAARWWAKCNGRKYDENVSGRVNAARLYDEIMGSRGMSERYRALDGADRANLGSVADFAVAVGDQKTDDVNARNFGGEAYGYARMLFNIKRVAGGKAQCMLLNKIASYSKTMCVQQSLFFPIATRFESPAGAVGFWTMIMSNLAPESGRRLGAAMENFDKLYGTSLAGSLNSNFIGFRDIVRMMDTDDPFMASAINLCSDLGISLSDRIRNPSEPEKGMVEADKQRLVAFVRRVRGDKWAKNVNSMLEGFLFRGSERAFSYALNATKIATVLQLAQRCEAECRRQGRAFNLVKEVKPYAAYLNAEIGGIDPLRYAWAHPAFRRLMNMAMFSWEWTKGAWAAGGGEIIEEALGGGHFTNPETRRQIYGRWLRMYGAIMIGVPMMMQLLVKAVSKLLGGYDGDDDDEWWTWQNEEKHSLSAFNITPLMRTIAKSDAAMWTKKNVPVLGWLLPAYTGKDAYNTTGGRKYYMHFGKQGWEFFRWFSAPDKQFLSKLSMPAQRLIEGLLGYNPGSPEFEQFHGKGFVQRWTDPSMDNALLNMAKAFLPFSWGAMGSYGDAGALSIVGPVSMGIGYRAALNKAEARLTAWALNERSGYSHGYNTQGKNGFRAQDVVTDILHDAKLNNMHPGTMLSNAVGLAAKTLYSRLYDALPHGDGDGYDEKEIMRCIRGLNRLGIVRDSAWQSMKAKLARHGRDWEKMSNAERADFRSTFNAAFANPYGLNADTVAKYRRLWPDLANDAMPTRQADRGGDNLGNFLATDKVPETLFGIPVVGEGQCTEKDVAFFEEHPEAGGYYDLGEEE